MSKFRIQEQANGRFIPEMEYYPGFWDGIGFGSHRTKEAAQKSIESFKARQAEIREDMRRTEEDTRIVKTHTYP